MKIGPAGRQQACAAATFEDGFTLIEFVVALMLMVIVIREPRGSSSVA